MSLNLLRTTVVALMILLSLAATGARAADAPRPNVVFVITDDQRWDSVGAAGDPFLKTPAMDRLAREGAYFNNAFVTTPLCSPARGSFLTGKYVRAHGIAGNGPAYAAPSHKLVTFPKLLRDAGYASAYVGKWHMGNDDSPRPGFDHWVSFKGQGRYNDCPLNVNGEQVEAKGYITDVVTDYAVDYLKKDHDKPFVLYVGHKAVHGPFRPADRHAELYRDEPLPEPPSLKDDLSGKPMLARKLEGKGREQLIKPGARNEETARDQLRCLVSVDEGLGRILDTLDERKLAENTIVIFTSDNGFFWGEHRLADKRAAYEESIRVPLLVRYPKLIKAGTKVEPIALNVDVLPTLLELAGAPVPRDVHGRSLVPLLEGETPGDWRKAALLEYEQEDRYPRVATWNAVRGDRWKLIRYPDLQGMDELYDLKADPYEMKNLIDAPEAAEAKEELTTELEKLIDATK